MCLCLSSVCVYRCTFCCLAFGWVLWIQTWVRMLYSKNWTYWAISPALIFFFLHVENFHSPVFFLMRIHSALLFHMVTLCSHNSCLLVDYVLAPIDWSFSIFYHLSSPVFKYPLFYLQLVWAGDPPQVKHWTTHWVASCPEIGFFRYHMEIMAYLFFWVGNPHFITNWATY